MSFIAELRRRNVIRMAGLYLVGAWLVVQVADTLLPVFDAPVWTMKVLVVVLAIGFLPALVFSWLFELTPAGLKRDIDIPTGASIAPHTARRLDRMIMAVMALALAYFALDKFVLSPESRSEPVTGAKTGSEPLSGAGHAVPSKSANLESGSDPLLADPPSVPTAAQINPKSIAVLAFADMSEGKDQEYLSDGIAEEILNALAQVDDLKVAGRTSSFYFKTRNESLKTIGEMLGVAHVLEGSVRKQGDRVRITAQLIQVKDGFHLWSETYDGDLDDVFALQERIARSITGKLEVVLSGEQQTRLVNAGTRNTEAYSNFLQATVTFNKRDIGRFAQAVTQLGQAITLDPGFARAHARLASVHAVNAQFSTGSNARELGAAERHARTAMALDPTHAEPHAALGFVLFQRREFLQSRNEIERALELDPDDLTAGLWSGAALLTTGYRKQGALALDRVLAIDPLLPIALYWRAWFDLSEGRQDDAERLFHRAADLGLPYAGIGLAWIAHAKGDSEAAIQKLSTGNAMFLLDLPDDAPEVIARGVFGAAAARARAVALIDAYLDTEPRVVTGSVPEFLLYLGEPLRALSVVQAAPTSYDAAFLDVLFGPNGKDARALPQFADFAQAIGLVELWDKYGAPDMCRRIPQGEYVCE